MVTLLPPISAMTYMFPTDRHTAIDQHDNQVVQMGHSGPATQQATQRRRQHPKYQITGPHAQLHPTPASNRCFAVGTQTLAKAHRPILTKGPSETHMKPIAMIDTISACRSATVVSFNFAMPSAALGPLSWFAARSNYFCGSLNVYLQYSSTKCMNVSNQHVYIFFPHAILVFVVDQEQKMSFLKTSI